jgi:hypothetical protein
MYHKIISIFVAFGMVIGLIGIVTSNVQVIPDSFLDVAGDKVLDTVGRAKAWGGEVIARNTTPPAIIDWGDGIIRATGRGTLPSDAESYPQAKLIAIGAAELDAQRILASTLRGIKVNSRRITDRYALKDYTVEENVKAALRGASTTDTRFLEDGNVEVDMEIHLKVKPEQIARKEIQKPAVPAEPQESFPEQISYYNPKSWYEPDAREYTSIVVDARGTGFRKARHLKIQAESGEAFFPPSRPTESVVEIPRVNYLAEEARLVEQGLGGAKPLKIVAAGATGQNNTQLVLSDSDVQYLGKRPETANLLKSGDLYVLVN